MHKEKKPGTAVGELPFEERVVIFKTLIQAIGITVGGDEEYSIRDYGSKFIAFHSTEDPTEKEKIKEEMDNIMKQLGKSQNPNLAEGVTKIIMGSSICFKTSITEV